MYPKIFMPLNASPYLSIIRWVKGSDVKANSIDTDQTAPVRSSLIWIYTVYSVCFDLSVGIYRVNMVILLFNGIILNV